MSLTIDLKLANRNEIENDDFFLQVVRREDSV